ncbi:MAG: hypothetical protein V1494_05060 [Candidatus Diapherotrites archaeon]
MELVFVLEAANILLLLALMYFYVKNYVHMKTSFGLGLIVFAFFLLVHNFVAAYYNFAMLDYYSVDAMISAAVVTAIETAALAVLLFITLRE